MGGLSIWDDPRSSDHTDVSPIASYELGDIADLCGSFGFPALLLAPPYLWPAPYIGLIQIAALIGFTTACFIGGWLADIITTRLILRAKGAFVPEQRLVALAPACWVGPAGCIVIAFCCDQKLSWIGIAFGFGMGMSECCSRQACISANVPR